MYDIIVVGAGPAGLTAALYALRSRKKVLVLEAKAYGGQILTAHKIENYPALPDVTGVEFADALYKQVEDLGVELKYETVVKIDEEKNVYTKENTYQAKAVILATGKINRKLDIEDEDDYLGKGVSYCAACDGNFYKNKQVAVVGGGNSALEDALYLSDIAKDVYLIHRRNEFRGEKKYCNELKNKENVHFILSSQVKKLHGKEKLESIDIENEDRGVQSLNVDGLFIAVGQVPQNSAFANLVDLDDTGHIVSKDGVHTNVERVYVAGDAREKELYQLTTAVSDGSIAATVAIREIRELE